MVILKYSIASLKIHLRTKIPKYNFYIHSNDTESSGFLFMSKYNGSLKPYCRFLIDELHICIYDNYTPLHLVMKGKLYHEMRDSS